MSAQLSESSQTKYTKVSSCQIKKMNIPFCSLPFIITLPPAPVTSDVVSATQICLANSCMLSE